MRIRIAENLSHKSAPVENLRIRMCVVQNLHRESALLHFLPAC